MSTTTTPAGQTRLAVQCRHCMWRSEGVRDEMREAYNQHLNIHPNQPSFEEAYPPPKGTGLVREEARAIGAVTATSTRLASPPPPRREREPVTNGDPKQKAIYALRAWSMNHDGKTPTQAQLGKDGLPGLSRLRSLFGSQNEAMVAAGLTPNTQPKRNGRKARSAPAKRRVKRVGKGHRVPLAEQPTETETAPVNWPNARGDITKEPPTLSEYARMYDETTEQIGRLEVLRAQIAAEMTAILGAA